MNYSPKQSCVSKLLTPLNIHFLYVFKRLCYPKHFTIHSSYCIHYCMFPRNLTHEHGIANAMLCYYISMFGSHNQLHMYSFNISDVVNVVGCSPGTGLHLQCGALRFESCETWVTTKQKQA